MSGRWRGWTGAESVRGLARVAAAGVQFAHRSGLKRVGVDCWAICPAVAVQHEQRNLRGVACNPAIVAGASLDIVTPTAFGRPSWAPNQCATEALLMPQSGVNWDMRIRTLLSNVASQACNSIASITRRRRFCAPPNPFASPCGGGGRKRRMRFSARRSAFVRIRFKKSFRYKGSVQFVRHSTPQLYIAVGAGRCGLRDVCLYHHY